MNGAISLSCMNFFCTREICDYILLNAYHCSLFSSKIEVRVRIRIRFSVQLVIGYAHLFILLSVVIVTLPLCPVAYEKTKDK